MHKSSIHTLVLILPRSFPHIYLSYLLKFLALQKGYFEIFLNNFANFSNYLSSIETIHSLFYHFHTCQYKSMILNIICLNREVSDLSFPLHMLFLFHELSRFKFYQFQVWYQKNNHH